MPALLAILSVGALPKGVLKQRSRSDWSHVANVRQPHEQHDVLVAKNLWLLRSRRFEVA